MPYVTGLLNLNSRIQMEELKQLANALVEHIEVYENKPTKDNSLRLRKVTQRLSNIGPSIRADLIAADKAK